MASNFLISTGPNDGVYWESLRPILVRLVSVGQRFQTKEGYLRDIREHDTDKAGMEFEVELVDVDNEPARFFTCQTHGLMSVLLEAGMGATVAIGWKRVSKNSIRLINVAWEVER